jgi:hypothetical protein
MPTDVQEVPGQRKDYDSQTAVLEGHLGRRTHLRLEAAVSAGYDLPECTGRVHEGAV